MKTYKPALRRFAAATFVGVLTYAAPAQDLPALAGANHSFGFDLLGQLAARQPGKNIFISPFSAACALQMVANGAAGQTKTEMADVLNTAGWSDKDLKETYRDLSRSLMAPRAATLTIANSIWHLKDGVLTPWKWNIHFTLTNVPPSGDATLTIAYASAYYARTGIYVNDRNKMFKLVTPAVEGGNALLREGIHAKYCVERVPIPVSRLRTGANTITLVVPPGRNNLPFNHVMYDYLDLELPANASGGR